MPSRATRNRKLKAPKPPRRKDGSSDSDDSRDDSDRDGRKRRRLKAGSLAARAMAAEAGLPQGPASYTDAFSWPRTQIEDAFEFCVDYKSRLIALLSEG